MLCACSILNYPPLALKILFPFLILEYSSFWYAAHKRLLLHSCTCFVHLSFYPTTHPGNGGPLICFVGRTGLAELTQCINLSNLSFLRIRCMICYSFSSTSEIMLCIFIYSTFQGKQKRNNRKGKDKGMDDMLDAPDKPLQESPDDEIKDFRTDVAEPVPENPDTLENVSDVSDSVDFAPEMLQPDSEDRDASPANWDTDTLEIHPATEASSGGLSGLSSIRNGRRDGNSTSAVDDSSSTCSTDSVPSVVTNGPYKGSLHQNHRSQHSPSR